MNRKRYQSELISPAFEGRPEQESVDNQSRRHNVFRRLGSYRIEIVIEIFLIFACMVLGVAFQFKVMLTVTLFCLAAAIPDWVTAWLVRRNDPDRRHGKTLMYFFIASGLMRTASLGLGTFICSMLAVVFIPFVMGLADVGAITGLIVTMGMFVFIFPITFVGVLHGRKLPGGIFFCRDLTKLRRLKDKGERVDLDIESMNPVSSLRMLAGASAISAAVFSMTVVILGSSLLAGNQMNEATQLILIAVVLAQLVVPVAWYVYFCIHFVDPWQPPEAVEDNDIEPLRPGEIQFLND